MKEITLEQKVEIEKLEEQLTINYDRFFSDKRFPLQFYAFREIRKLQQQYWILTETYYSRGNRKGDKK